MTTMISEVYSAFKTAGAPEQEARQAAEALSAENLATRSLLAEDKRDLSGHIVGAEQRLCDKVDAFKQELSDKIDGVKEHVSNEISEVKRIMSEILWMQDLVIVAVVLPILWEIIVAWS